MLRRARTLLLLGLVLPGAAQAGTPRAGLDAVLAEPAIRGARVGVLVADLASGELLVEHQSDRALVPAS